MKKLILLALLTVGTCFVASAQTDYKLTNNQGYLKSTFTHNATDTITNAITENQYVQVDGYNEIITIQPTFTKISGTAAATAKMQGSVDFVGWTDIGSSYTVTDVATQTTAFILTPSNYRYYRLNVVPTGTQSVKLKTPVIVRKKT